jgi:hypothetical protein
MMKKEDSDAQTSGPSLQARHAHAPALRLIHRVAPSYRSVRPEAVRRSRVLHMAPVRLAGVRHVEFSASS